ncbi:MAG: hypothetical protein ACREWI_10135 [Telluria sp.]
MKSVTFSEIVRIRERPFFLGRPGTWRQLLPWALTVAVGLPLLMLTLHAIDPQTPLPFIVLPALAGALVPVAMLGPGRFEMNTRFDAHDMIGTLDEALVSLGYRRTLSDPDHLSYFRPQPWLRGREGSIDVAVKPHALQVVGPVGSLRLLQQRITC